MHQYKPCKHNHKTFLSLNKKQRRLNSAWTWTKNDLKLIDSLPKESPESTQNGNTHSDTVTENVSVRQSADSPADKNDASCSSKDAEILCNITSQKSTVIQNTINTNAVRKIFPCKLFKLPKWKHVSQQTEIHTFCRSTQTHAKNSLTKILRHLGQLNMLQRNSPTAISQNFCTNFGTFLNFTTRKMISFPWHLVLWKTRLTQIILHGSQHYTEEGLQAVEPHAT